MVWKNEPPLYTTWETMIGRCYNPNQSKFKYYGGRGIKVSPEWRHNFKQFEEDMGPRPTPHHTLDRIDNNGDYTPQNCRWATWREQRLNQSNTAIITIEGIGYKVLELVEKYGVCKQTIIKRASLGMSFEAITKPGFLLWSESKLTNKCKNGHEYTPDNTHLLKNGKRMCRICEKAKDMKYKRKIKRRKLLAKLRLASSTWDIKP